MKVKNLILELQRLNPEEEIYYYDWENISYYEPEIRLKTTSEYDGKYITLQADKKVETSY